MLRNSLFTLLILTSFAKADEVTVNLYFSINTPAGVYQDTLKFTEDEWNKKDQASIDASKQALADTWVNFITQQRNDQQKLQTIQGKQDKVTEIDASISDLEATKQILLDEIATASK